MTELGPDQLFLQGRLQIETALDALMETGMNPDAERQLITFLGIHSRLSGGERDEEQELIVYLEDGPIERTKTDIIISLELAERDPTFRHVEAARGLLELLKAK